MRHSRALHWAGGILLALVLLVAVIAALPNWNWLREPLARKVTNATGRSFAINGDLIVRLGFNPHVIVNDVSLGNAEWAREPTMATLKRADFRINLLRLIGGRLWFRDLTLSEPHVALEARQDGTANWNFDDKPPADPDKKTTELPQIDALTIDQGTATYRDPRIKTDVALQVRTVEGTPGAPEGKVEISGKGTFKGAPATLKARGGSLLSLRSPDNPYPVTASAVLGSTKASIDGMLLDPLHLAGEQVNFTLEGSNLEHLYPIVGVPLPPTPPYKLAGYLDHKGDVWTFRGFKGKVGQSDLSGDFSVDRGRQPQAITAKLVSQQLRMEDLSGFVGAGDHERKVPQPPDKVLPVEPFSLEKLQAANADVTFRGEKIVTAKTPLEKMSAHLIVKDGVLKLTPLDFGVAGGHLLAQVEMDGRKKRIVTHADITAQGMDFQRMFPDVKLTQANTGTMGGRAKLTGTGNSPAQMLGTANGEAALIMDGGTVSELILRISNLDIANAVARMLGGDKQVAVRCMVGNFKVTDGDFKIDTLLLDTPKVNLAGTGDINLADETLNLRLESENKTFSLASLRGPVVVTGTLKTPAPRPEMGNVVARGGLALALGAVTAGIGALLPLLEFGKPKESNCKELMEATKKDVGVKQSDLQPRRKK